MKTRVEYRAWLIRFMLYNAVFFFLQLSYVVSQGSHFLSALPLPTVVYGELMMAFVIHLGLYSALSWGQAFLFWGLLQQANRAGVGFFISSRLDSIHLAVWGVSVGALYLANVYFFPLSTFSRLILPEMPWILVQIGFVLCLSVLGFLALNAVWMLVRNHARGFAYGFLLMPLLFLFYPKSEKNRQFETSHPNVILIGVDSLDPGQIHQNHLPAITRFLSRSVYFRETISPLARTYPAWTSILTGLYPKHHRARYNLMPPEWVDPSNTLAWTLQKKGYLTRFATDDRRFNRIDQAYGFQAVIGPKLGVNDLLLGTFQDFPISNLLVNFPIGRWLFPYNHMNRASHFSYYPDSFNAALHSELTGLDRSKPLFLAVHFTLPHWPYAWAASSPLEVNNEYSPEAREGLYLAALKEVDRQVDRLFNDLLDQGFLKNSMVVLLSDHGEALYQPGSRQTFKKTYQGGRFSPLASYFERKTSTALEKSAGHGSDLLSSAQYHCLLAFQIYRNHRLITSARSIADRVALIDIAPTIEDFLNIPADGAVDGISLLDAIRDAHPILPHRRFFLESGMLPNQFLSREKAKALGQQYFTITPQGQLQLNSGQLAALDAMKLYAVLDGNWLLALYPDDDGSIPVIMRLTDYFWVDDLNTAFAEHAPAGSMFEELKRFYAMDFQLKRMRQQTP